MILIYILLVVIAVGVLLLSDTGQKILRFFAWLVLIVTTGYLLLIAINFLVSDAGSTARGILKSLIGTWFIFMVTYVPVAKYVGDTYIRPISWFFCRKFRTSGYAVGRIQKALRALLWLLALPYLYLLWRVFY